MQRDKKLGLALGVLLIGIVAAFFFRLDHKPKKRAPNLNNAQALDKQIAGKPGAPYVDDKKNDKAGATPNQNKVAEPPLWQMPEFLADGKNKMPEDWLAHNPAAPDPIPSETLALGEEVTDEMFEDDGLSNKQTIATTVSQTKPKTIPAKNTPAKNEATENKPNNSPPAEPESYIIHEVRSGDTLSKLASQYLGSSARFHEIYTLNKEVLDDANNLVVGTELKIPKRGQSAQKPKSNPLIQNADGRRRIDAKNASTGKIAPPDAKVAPKNTPNAPDAKNAPPRRFVPVSRPPFTHGRRDYRTSENNAPDMKQTLSQIPPADLPDID